MGFAVMLLGFSPLVTTISKGCAHGPEHRSVCAREAADTAVIEESYPSVLIYIHDSYGCSLDTAPNPELKYPPPTAKFLLLRDVVCHSCNGRHCFQNPSCPLTCRLFPLFSVL
jgi:hypothetical protein